MSGVSIGEGITNLSSGVHLLVEDPSVLDILSLGSVTHWRPPHKNDELLDLVFSLVTGLEVLIYLL